MTPTLDPTRVAQCSIMLLITAAEAAEILGVAVTTVYDLVQRG